MSLPSLASSQRPRLAPLPGTVMPPSQTGCSAAQETGVGGTPNAKLAIPMAPAFTAVIRVPSWMGTAPAAIERIRGASLWGLRLATTLILMVPTASLRGLRLATTLILTVPTFPKLARLVPDGSQAPLVLPLLERR